MIQTRRLRLDDLDRARGQLRVRRPGRLVIYLDELTLDLVTAWISASSAGPTAPTPT